MPQIIETTVYEFHELSDAAKEKARAWFREGAGDWDWYDFIYDDFEEICRILGIELRTVPVRLMGGGTRQKPCIWFSGFCSQGDGACFEGVVQIRERLSAAHPRPCAERCRAAPHRRPPVRDPAGQLLPASRRRSRHRGRYCHAYAWRSPSSATARICQDMTDGAEDAVTECLRDLANWLYRQLEREWDHMMSDEYADEGIAANGYTFTDSGRRFG